MWQRRRSRRAITWCRSGTLPRSWSRPRAIFSPRHFRVGCASDDSIGVQSGARCNEIRFFAGDTAVSFFRWDSAAAWAASGLQADESWIFHLGGKARSDIAAAVKAAWSPDRSLFEYCRDDFDLG